jgi:NitT/TauT family transport system ATP-binding protein
MTSATLPYTSEPHAGNGALLKVDRVQIGYWGTRGYVAAVDDVSFEVQGREKVIVIGQSGSGKSTLLKTVGGYLQPTSGTVSINGNLSLTPGPDRAFVFQEFDQLFPWRTVLDNVAYPLRRNGWGRRDAQDRAREFLELTRLSHAIDRYPHELSGGMKQRVAIARALALEPLILLMDEPFGALDALTRARLQRELRAILDRTHTTLLFVTHSIDEALVLGDRIVILRGAPSRLDEVIDVRDIGSPESESYAAMRVRLRRLLAVEEDEEEDEDEFAVFS